MVSAVEENSAVQRNGECGSWGWRQRQEVFLFLGIQEGLPERVTLSRVSSVYTQGGNTDCEAAWLPGVWRSSDEASVGAVELRRGGGER